MKVWSFVVYFVMCDDEGDAGIILLLSRRVVQRSGLVLSIRVSLLS